MEQEGKTMTQNSTTTGCASSLKAAIPPKRHDTAAEMIVIDALPFSEVSSGI